MKNIEIRNTWDNELHLNDLETAKKYYQQACDELNIEDFNDEEDYREAYTLQKEVNEALNGCCSLEEVCDVLNHYIGLEFWHGTHYVEEF